MITHEQGEAACAAFVARYDRDPHEAREVRMRAALEAAEAAAWRPIAEAPRDGTKVLVCNSGGVWDDRQVLPGIKAPDGQPLNGRQFRTNHKGRPTHYRPLPSPPTGEP